MMSMEEFIVWCAQHDATFRATYDERNRRTTLHISFSCDGNVLTNQRMISDREKAMSKFDAMSRHLEAMVRQINNEMYRSTHTTKGQA